MNKAPSVSNTNAFANHHSLMEEYAVELLRKAKKFSRKCADQKSKKEFDSMVEEIQRLRSKQSELDELEAIRLKYAQLKLESLLHSGAPPDIEISPSTDELLVEEIRLFHEVIRLGKVYNQVTIELPKNLTEQTLMLLKSALADFKHKPDLVIRGSVPQSLIESLFAFKRIEVRFTDKEETEKTLINLCDSEARVCRSRLILDFRLFDCEWASGRIPLLAAEICNKRGVNVLILFLSLMV